MSKTKIKLVENEGIPKSVGNCYKRMSVQNKTMKASATKSRMNKKKIHASGRKW